MHGKGIGLNIDAFDTSVVYKVVDIGAVEGRRPLGSGEATGWPTLSQILRAKRIARPTSTIFVGGKDVINDPIFPFETVCK